MRRSIQSLNIFPGIWLSNVPGGEGNRAIWTLPGWNEILNRKCEVFPMEYECFILKMDVFEGKQFTFAR